MLDVDPAIAASLGWPKLKYAALELERRWLCARLPAEASDGFDLVSDLYISGTRLRLREVLPGDGGPPARRLSRKADVEPAVRLLTNIYLDADEYGLMSGLPGVRIRKARHRLTAPDGVKLTVDVFEGGLSGLVLAEAEFEDRAAMLAYTMPAFAVREVTADPRYTGARLAADGLPV